MTTPYTGTATWHPTLDLPDDSDAPTAVVFTPPWEGLQDNIRYLAQGAGCLSVADTATMTALDITAGTVVDARLCFVESLGMLFRYKFGTLGGTSAPVRYQDDAGDGTWYSIPYAPAMTNAVWDALIPNRIVYAHAQLYASAGSNTTYSTSADTWLDIGGFASDSVDIASGDVVTATFFADGGYNADTTTSNYVGIDFYYSAAHHIQGFVTVRENALHPISVRIATESSPLTGVVIKPVVWWHDYALTLHSPYSFDVQIVRP